MKQVGTSLWVSPNPADNSSGLTLLPGGLNITDGSVVHPPANIGYFGEFLHSDYDTTPNGFFTGRVFFRNTDTTATINVYNRPGYARSVRLIKN